MLRTPNLVMGDMERCDVASSDYRQTEAAHLANITRSESQVSKPGPSVQMPPKLEKDQSEKE